MTNDQQIWYALTSILAGFLGGFLACVTVAYMIKRTNPRKPKPPIQKPVTCDYCLEKVPWGRYHDCKMGRAFED